MEEIPVGASMAMSGQQAVASRSPLGGCLGLLLALEKLLTAMSSFTTEPSLFTADLSSFTTELALFREDTRLLTFVRLPAL